MEKYIPYEKLSKKKKRELDGGKRRIWAISPVTRKPENPKAYNRKKAQKRMDDPGSVLSFFCCRGLMRIFMNDSGSSVAGQSPGKLVL